MKHELLTRQSVISTIKGMPEDQNVKIRCLRAILKISTVQPMVLCSEGLPDDGKDKLVYLSSGRFTIACYNSHCLPHSPYKPIGWGYCPENGKIDFDTETVVAWAPLPEPVKPE